MSDARNMSSEKAVTQKCADRINDYWKSRGVDAGARILLTTKRVLCQNIVIKDDGKREVEEYYRTFNCWSIKSNLTGREQP